ncbi:hypothetical protein ACVI1L_004514 [Bradyrhizobium sp. USDA 4516]|nr:hypothetical protein [Bradyrhizobium sp. USDA 4541]
MKFATLLLLAKTTRVNVVAAAKVCTTKRRCAFHTSARRMCTRSLPRDSDRLSLGR